MYATESKRKEFRRSDEWTVVSASVLWYSQKTERGFCLDFEEVQGAPKQRDVVLCRRYADFAQQLPKSLV